MRVEVPDGNVLVPLQLFALVYNEAERAFRVEPGPYLAGTVAAFRWVAGVDDATPLHRERRPADPASIEDEDMRATMISLDPPGSDPRVGPVYAAGVASTLGWVRGVLDRAPITLPAASA